jgi:crossover junction endodeoxyribonuclease RuvC
MRVLGIDPSLTATGLASSIGWAVTVGRPGHRDDTWPQRLVRINLTAAEVITFVPRDVGLVVIEGPSYSRGADPSAFDRAALWWLIYRGCHLRELPVAVVTAGQLKVYATGKGTAGKGAIIDAVARRWPAYATNGDDNACDAVVLMAMGCDWAGQPLCDMPQTHRRALERVAWPENTNRKDSTDG